MTERAPETLPPPPPIAKARHGCLTAYLALVIAVNPIAAFRAIRVIPAPGSRAAHAPVWLLITLVVLLLLNVLYAVALLRWKRWGLYGLLVNAAAAFALNVLRGGNPLFAGVIAVGVMAILLVVVNVGKDRRAWPQLE